MIPRLQLRFYILVLRALNMLLYRQLHADFRTFDSQADVNTTIILDDIRALIEDMKA